MMNFIDTQTTKFPTDTPKRRRPIHVVQSSYIHALAQ